MKRARLEEGLLEHGWSIIDLGKISEECLDPNRAPRPVKSMANGDFTPEEIAEFERLYSPTAAAAKAKGRK